MEMVYQVMALRMMQSLIKDDDNHKQDPEVAELKQMLKELKGSKEDRWKKEMEQRVQRAEYLAQQPTQQQQQTPSLLDIVSKFQEERSALQSAIPNTPPGGEMTPEAAEMHARLKALDGAIASVTKLTDKSSDLLNKVGNFAIEDMRAQTEQRRLQDPDYAKYKAQSYADLGNRVLRDLEEGEDDYDYGEGEVEEFTDADDMSD